MASVGSPEVRSRRSSLAIDPLLAKRERISVIVGVGDPEPEVSTSVGHGAGELDPVLRTTSGRRMPV
jgi:hypothetical protein